MRQTITILFATALLTTAALAQTPNPSGPLFGETCYFVGNPETANEVDQAYINIMVDELGLDVTYVGMAADNPIDADTFDMVFISSTVTSGSVGDAGPTDYLFLAKPVVLTEMFIYDDLALTGANADQDYGRARLDDATPANILTDVVIQTPSHPIAAGFTGTVTILNEAARMTFGVPVASGTVVAGFPAGTVIDVDPAVAMPSNGAAVFAFDTGATLADTSSALERRVGLPFFDVDSGPQKMSDDGKAIFGAALAWALGIDLTSNVEGWDLY